MVTFYAGIFFSFIMYLHVFFPPLSVFFLLSVAPRWCFNANVLEHYHLPFHLLLLFLSCDCFTFVSHSWVLSSLKTLYMSLQTQAHSFITSSFPDFLCFGSSVSFLYNQLTFLVSAWWSVHTFSAFIFIFFNF